ncbi:DUF2892 domain-containing protein [Affinibrenneria salicis]|uniref:DUF2892 domain-containing protein n=1 Tax=Affinibrenneria salicis TaxID=2590031 RepID=A0A5J5G2A0_9GAMM|nr:rhodanese family protein [Affinibrenneria salicis]KAA9000755.1 DUF2892 domain-containing protein [Affinibrenneria salicis]
MSITNIPPRVALEKLNAGALLIDIRAADDYAREHIAQAQNIPLEQLAARKPQLNGGRAVIYHCRSGQRTRMHADALAADLQCDSYILTDGLEGWKQAGLPTVIDRDRPLELNRQVQIAAGGIVVLGFLLGLTISPWFHILSGFVGAGLIFAGVSGFCGLARVLMKMPWNRKAQETTK